MKSTLKELIAEFNQFNFYTEINRGIERECLRVLDHHGIAKLSHSPHPESLGSALTHPYVTTDFCESQLEFITPVFQDPQELIQFLYAIHSFTAQKIAPEIFWNNSMPCPIKGQESIPIAQYGKSNLGKMKTVYRKGLHQRYGSMMQTISGIHYNFSFSKRFFENMRCLESCKNTLQDFQSDVYMNMVRNIHRFNWVIPYLFGASPFICPSFLNGKKPLADMITLNSSSCLTFDGATSIRLSNLGYTNSSQKGLNVCYNKLGSYINVLRQAITTSEPAYEKIGVLENGEYKQLNTNTLQIENEYYGSVRPKRRTDRGESPSNALLRRGIEYIELRTLDINPFSPVGIEVDQVYFLDIFLTYCAFLPAPNYSIEQIKRFRNNQELIARHGRQKKVVLFDGDKEITHFEWIQELFGQLAPIAEMLDSPNPEKLFTTQLNQLKNKVIIEGQTFSTQMMQEIVDQQLDFCHYTLAKSQNFTTQLRQLELNSQQEKYFKSFQSLVKKSINDQKTIEKSDLVNFDQYLKEYFSQNLN
jgi:glutamate--cysteine ligase